MRNRLIFSLLSALLLGAAVSALSTGADFWRGWLAASLLAFLAVLALSSAWKWAGGGRGLALMVALAFLLRLGVGIGASLAVQTYGYDEKVQKAGYLFSDAYTRDLDAWSLAQSDKPVWSSFQQDFVSDQYGGAIALSTLIYRALSPDAHRRFLILILTAALPALGLPFFWQALRRRWDAPLANLAGWLMALYPEGILLGAAQLREPFLIGLACIAFWAVFAWRNRKWQAALSFTAAILLMALFSWRVAAAVLGILIICFWLEYLDDLPSKRWRTLGWVGLAAAALAVAALSYGWMASASTWDAALTQSGSGWMQKIIKEIGEGLRVPFMTVYGLAQPVLPAILVDDAAPVWKVIGLLRAGGWYALAPFLLYAIFAALKALPARDRRLLVGAAASVVLWLLISSARAGGDQWDNPRYRMIFFPWMALLVSWGWYWAKKTSTIWLKIWIGAELIFLAFFTSWYISRYTGLLGRLPFWVMVGAILALSALLMALGWWWQQRRRGVSTRQALANARAWLTTFLQLKPPAPAPVSRRVNRWDWLAAALFLAFAVLYFLGRLQGNFPIVLLSGDASNIASYAAARNDPQLFTGDPALGDSNAAGVYATLHIPLLQAVAAAAGDYGLAFTWLLLPHIFLHLLGYYILGRALFKSRLWAFVFAWLSAMMVIDVGLGEFWGLWRDALPRFTFQALLPYLLTLALHWKDTPTRWPWLMLLAGALVYAHPISAPTWGFAIWLGLWLCLPPAWTWRRRILTMLSLGILFVLMLMPFAVNYFSYQASSQPADLAAVRAILEKYYPADLLNPPAALAAFVLAMSKNLLIPVALLGLAAAWFLLRGQRQALKLVLIWAAGIAAVTLLIPSLERLIEQALHILPLETELTRGIRYFVPLLLIFWVWPFALFIPRLNQPAAARVFMALGLLLALFWSATHNPDGRRLLAAVSCLARGQLVCETDRQTDGMLLALRDQTPPGTCVFNFNEDPRFNSNTLMVRYAALRPMVYTIRDHGILSYANRAALPTWLNTTLQVEELQTLTSAALRLERLIPLAKSLGAEVLVVDFKLSEKLIAAYPVDIVFKNETYTILNLRNPDSCRK